MRQTIHRTVRLTLRGLAVAALLLSLPAAADQKAAPVKDSQLGLSKTSVFDVPTPPAYKIEDGSPGEKPLPRRLSREIPPVVPHSVGDYLPITRVSNQCVDCHAIAGPKKKGEPTPLPRSHFVDFRHPAGPKGETLAGARWVCVSCHVPRSDAKPLVGSRYKP